MGLATWHGVRSVAVPMVLGVVVLGVVVLGGPGLAAEQTAAPVRSVVMPAAAAPPAWEVDRPVRVDALPRAPGCAQVAQGAQLVADNQPTAALAALGDTTGAAAALVRSRAQRLLGRLPEATSALAEARRDSRLARLCDLEEGRLAAARGDAAATVARLLPLVDAGGPLASEALPSLLGVLATSNPNVLLSHMSSLEKALPKQDRDARSLLLESKALAEDRLGRGADALATRLQRYIEEPVSVTTPDEPPVGAQLSAEQHLQRIERLLEAHRNERALQALEALPPDASLTPQALCRRQFAEGLAARKLRRYGVAEDRLTYVAQQCQDVDLARRAAYLRAKVISIRDGLRAIDAIEAFVRKYPDHSMNDDVLFWAGDLYQRRGRDADAEKYFARIENTPPFDDHCGEARWRLAWMAYRRADVNAARAGLLKLLTSDGCAPDAFDQARAHYWLGRLFEQQNDKPAALEQYRATLDTSPLSFYAQEALPRLLKLQAPAVASATQRAFMAPATDQNVLALCPDALATQPAFADGMAYLLMGLNTDAAAEFRSLETPARNVMGDAHAAALGVAPGRPAGLHAVQRIDQCGPTQAALLLVLLLDKAGAQHDAHWRLRTEFGDEFQHFPTPQEMVVWRAAYPLAYREFIAPAEQESHLPMYFLQALAREESAFDPNVVSWAEAYGLTQLVLTSGQGAGRYLNPPVVLRNAEQLLDPGLNARLGAALLSNMVRRFGGNLGLALAAYNAGEDVAATWWKRFQGQDFAIYAEEMTIQETRGYVKRVLRTYGIYRWLYGATLPTLPVEPMLPPRP